MRVIDLHCYPNTQTWIDCQGPYVDALAKYWKREWKAKEEAQVAAEFRDNGIEACLVALDLSTTINTPPCSNDYVAGMRDRNSDCVLNAWGAVEPSPGKIAIDEARHAILDLKMMGFHFHPIMQHFSVDDERYYPLWEEIAGLKAPVMIDAGAHAGHADIEPFGWIRMIFQELKDFSMKEVKMNKHHWFRRKTYGWGWTPANAKGWITLIGYIVSISIYPLIAEKENNEISVLVFLLVTGLLTIGLFWICYTKGEKLSWNWGDEK